MRSGQPSVSAIFAALHCFKSSGNGIPYSTPKTAQSASFLLGDTAQCAFLGPMKTKANPIRERKIMKLPKPAKAWAIVDCRDLTIIETSGSGHLNIFYDRSDAETMLPAVKRGADTALRKHLIVLEIYLSR